jgi:hypothetical protein
VNNLKDEFIKAIMKSLKIDNNPFIYATVDEFISHLKPTDYKAFMSELFGTQHSFLNGLDRIAKVAETFKPIVSDDTEARANELIALVYSMNATVFDNAKTSGRTFDDELRGTKFKNIEDDIVILNQVKPYTDFKQLVSKISCYATSLEQLQAFKRAIEFSQSYSGAIASCRVKELKI